MTMRNCLCITCVVLLFCVNVLVQLASAQEISPINLSSKGTANCYIVSQAGLYKFRAVKGNSSVVVGKVVSASVLWESYGTAVAPTAGDLIQRVVYKEGYVAFQTADEFKEGNAVIAAKDANGRILWSWHIWLTDQPEEHVYFNNAGTMMDRNLGATSATPRDVGALGLLYQWGRKDPFLGSSSISSDTAAESTITWPSAVMSNSIYGTIRYATSNPTTFIAAGSNGDWYYTGSISTDNTRWTTSRISKSVYDPCPTGWRVPDGGVWATACDLVGRCSANMGMNLSGKFASAANVWYPSSGYLDYYTSELCCVGIRGNYWSASPYGNYAYLLYFDTSHYFDSCLDAARAEAYSLRCVKEE